MSSSDSEDALYDEFVKYKRGMNLDEDSPKLENINKKHNTYEGQADGQIRKMRRKLGIANSSSERITDTRLQES